MDEPRHVSESDPNGGGPDGLAGSMGVSSERVGKVRGSPRPGTHGTEETHPSLPPQENPPPEQSVDPSTPEVRPDNDVPAHQMDPRGSPGHLPH